MLKISKLENGTIELKGSLTVHTIEELYVRLKEIVKEEAPRGSFRIGLNEITEMDTGGAQLLTALHRSYPEVSLVPVESTCVRGAMHRSGLEQHLVAMEEQR